MKLADRVLSILSSALRRAAAFVDRARFERRAKEFGRSIDDEDTPPEGIDFSVDWAESREALEIVVPTASPTVSTSPKSPLQGSIEERIARARGDS